MVSSQADVLRSEAEKSRLTATRRKSTTQPAARGRRAGTAHRRAALRSSCRIFLSGYDGQEFKSLHYTIYKMWLDEIRFRTLDQNERGRSAIDQI